MIITEPVGLLSPPQLAAYLNVPLATIYDWRHRRCGPPGFRLGKHVRYQADVERWIDDQARDPPPAGVDSTVDRGCLMASIHKRVTAKGETRWLVRYRDPNSVQRTRSFRLKIDASRFAVAVETDINRGDWVNPDLARETFSHWADQWLASTYHLKPKSQEGYRSVLNHHLLPKLGNTPVARIDLPMVTSLLSQISRNGAGAGTVGTIRGALGLVLEQARRSGAVRTNPVADTKPPGSPNRR